MKYIVVDLEMNPVAKEYKVEKQMSKMEIIEIGEVIMDERFMIFLGADEDGGGGNEDRSC